jgi:trehalose 2-sulfotransferase
MLCEMLRGTGCAGQPLEHFELLRHTSLPRQPREYFDELDAPHVLERLAPIDPGAPSTEPPQGWWARILAEGRSPNGVWAGKLMWGHVEDFLARVRELPGLAGANLASALHRLLDDPQLVFVTREDKVAQAVSLWRAVQTQSWRADDSARHDDPTYDFTAIDYLVAQLQDDEQAWKRWFAATGASPLVLTYEQLEQTPQACVARVLEALELPASKVPEPPLARQRDERSLAWIERYHREREQAA